MAEPDLCEFRRSYLSASVFWERAVKNVESLTNDEIHCASPSRAVKALTEEVLPLAYLLKHLDRPRRRVRCKYFGSDSDRLDARLKLVGNAVDRGSLEPQYGVEITSAQSPTHHLSREALELYGSVWSDPGIYAEGSRHKNNRRIVSQPTVQDGDAPMHYAKEWVREAVKAKLEKTYPEPVILLVAVRPEGLLSKQEWPTVAAAVPVEAYDRFSMVYLIDRFTGRVS